MKKLGSLIAFLNVLCMVVSAQNIQSIVGTYAVSEVCTLVQDTSYKESLDYTISLEAWQEQEYCMRFLIPSHGIPDFVLVESINDGNFSFAQKFNLEDSMGGEPYYLNINGNGRVQKDSLLMEYVLATIGSYGSLQCNVKGIRQTVGMEGNEVVQQFSVSVSPNPIRERFRINSDIELGEWRVYSVSGKLILSGKGKDTEIDCQNWASGIYVFRWESKNHETGFVKIVKE